MIGFLAALSNNAKAVVGEVFKAVGAALDEFHLAVEAFSDAIVFGEAPHGRQGFSPGREGMSEGEERGEGTGFELIDKVEQFGDQRAAGTFCLMLEVEEGAEAVHSVIEGLESRVFGKEGFEAQRVGGRKVVLSFAQGSQRAAMVLDWRGDLAGQLQEVLGDNADDMEAIGHDLGSREVGSNQAAIGTGKIDANHANLVSALESAQKAAQIPWTAAGNNIEDPVVLKITEGGGKTLPLVKGVLVDPENPRALQT